MENISNENSYLTTVTKTSQMLSSGMLKFGGKLDRKSSPVGNTITLETRRNVMFTKIVILPYLPHRVRYWTLNFDLIDFLEFFYPLWRKSFIELSRIFTFNLMRPNTIRSIT